MQFDEYRRLPKSVKAIKITEQLFTNPDCDGGRLIYSYRDDNWTVASVEDPANEGIEGDYIVEWEGELHIVEGNDFEGDYRLVPPPAPPPPPDPYDYLNYPG